MNLTFLSLRYCQYIEDTKIANMWCSLDQSSAERPHTNLIYLCLCLCHGFLCATSHLEEAFLVVLKTIYLLGFIVLSAKIQYCFYFRLFSFQLFHCVVAASA